MISTLNVVEGTLEGYRKFYERTPAGNRLLFTSAEFLSYRTPTPLTFLDWRTPDASFAQTACWIKSAPNGTTSIVIPGGASFGGPVAQRPLRVADHHALLEALVAFTHSNGHARIEWTPPMPHHGIESDEEGEFAALQSGFKAEIAGMESVVALPVTADSKLRNLLRKCQREGVEYIGDIDLETFYPTLEDIYARHGTSPTHSKEELSILKTRLPQDIRFVGATKDGELAATACLFRISPASELVFYLCTADKHKKHNPMVLLIAEDMDRSAQTGCRFYNFGTSSIGLEVRDNVLNFKQQFGARGFMRRRLIWQSP